MGWFNQNREEDKNISSIPEFPRLPELPNLNKEPPKIIKEQDKKKISQLPMFPNNSFGQKFSQDTIKDAVIGKKENKGESEDKDIHHEIKDEHTEHYNPQQMMQNTPPRIPPQLNESQDYKPLNENHLPESQEYMPLKNLPPIHDKPDLQMNKEIESDFSNNEVFKSPKEERVFIRLDKFEENIENFEKIKEQIKDMEKILLKTKEIKEKESLEIETWEREIMLIKKKIEKIDRDLFSKLD